MRILFTGASSFTGYWFVRTLAGVGHEVVCPLNGSLAVYEGVRKRRVEALAPVCRLVPETAFGTPQFMDLVRSRAWDLLCHHGAYTANYRSPDFDTWEALRNNTLELPRVLAALKEKGLRGVVLTGTVFENDEGKGDEPRPAFSPYGLSKGLTWQMFRHYCAAGGVPLGKFVIPNPFGPFEEPRFTAYLVKMWKTGAAAAVKTPDYLRDNIHVDLLAEVYGQFVGRVAALDQGFIRINPSGYAETQGEFAARVAREVRARTGWTCELRLGRQEDFTEPLRRVNTDPAAPLAPGWSEAAAWDQFVGFYTR
jgi:nucleoside-diphosphate-sugar epimerase